VPVTSRRGQGTQRESLEELPQQQQAALHDAGLVDLLLLLVASCLLQNGTDIRIVQDLPGHADVSTTMIYLHVIKRPGAGGPSPLDLP